MSLRYQHPTIQDVVREEKNIEEIHFMKLQLFKLEKNLLNNLENPFKDVKLVPNDKNLIEFYDEEIDFCQEF